MPVCFLSQNSTSNKQLLHLFTVTSCNKKYLEFLLNLHIPLAMNKFVETEIARRMLEIAKGFMSADVVSL